ncbi:hypothetical protein ASPCADRAFT_206923 [Aspergillus carbonarius ITEM 5010]|uniref:BYS1 domain protein n=1 Tax=Aspergillus carbonarius (strain ITEM 5010) TaxID=602072 RepID=A0A1R3RQK3_ASPC5|nr:hypothetical protein ASPCADRAFT_206923 [Aspergillus carbonarius ITEM 5010]
MHLLSTLTFALLPLLPLTHAIGSAVVQNNCTYPVYLWSVGGSIGPSQTIASGSSYSETFHRDPTSGGISLKITKTSNGLFDGSPQTNYAYTLDTDTSSVFYDLSDVFGDPFSGSALSVVPSDSGCGSICWANGVPPAGSQVKSCQQNSNEVLTLCASSC